MWLALAAHTGFGLYLVLVKYLSPRTPILFALSISFGLTAAVAFFLARRELSWRNYKDVTVWVLSFVIVVRSASKLLALQYTLVAYVQLIDMIVPFLTPIAAWMLMRERIPPRTIPALLATSVGSFLVITVDPFNLHLPGGHSDLVGIGIALGSSIAMAFLVAYLRKMSTAQYSPLSVSFHQSLALCVAYGLMGLAGGERVSAFTSFSSSLWVIYILFTIFAVMGATISQVLAISKTKASFYSSLLSWRLIVAVGMGWLILGEHLRSLWQVAGIAIVVVALTLYLRYQAHLYRRALLSKERV